MGIYMVQWNIRGVRANSAWLRHRIFSSSDVLALQETFLNPSVPFHLPGKIIYRLDRNQRRGGGLLLAVRNCFSSILLSFPAAGVNEALGVEIRFPSSFRLQVINIYSPPGSVNEHWLQQIIDLCTPPFILVGDFNAHHSCWGSARDSRRGVSVFNWTLNNNLCLINSSVPTRHVSGGRPALLDLSFSSPDLFADIDFHVYPDPFDSDHCPVQLWLRRPSLASACPTVRLRYDWGMAARLLNSSFQASPISSVEDFLSICRDSMSASSRSIRIVERAGSPWWDSRCSYLLGQKRKYLRLAKRWFNSHFWTLYKKYAALLRKEIHDARRSFWARTCSSASRTGSIFRILRALQNRRSSSFTSHHILSLPSVGPQGRRAEANALAAAFARCSTESWIPLDFSANVTDSIRLPFTMSELCLALRKSSHRTPGKDGVSLRLLSALNSHSLHRLLHCYNQTWQTGIVPSSWREALVIPILKPGKPSATLSSYRPIALTSVLYKVFERMLLHRLLPWILDNNIFHSNHFGFLPFRDCTPALLKLYGDLLSARQQRFVTVLVSLDIAAAFDSVWPDGLALKLLMAGVDGHFARWVHLSMLRTLQVRWCGELSDEFDSEVGVPQGAVLSPLLFSFYMRDLFDVLGPWVQGIVFADDTYVYFSGPDLTAVFAEIQRVLSDLVRWCSYWKLQLNPSKSSAIVFARRKVDPATSFRLLGEEVPWVSSIRILGLIFERNLTWNAHVSRIRGKARTKLDVFRCVAHISRGIGTRDLLRLSDATVVSCLRYGSPVFSMACVSTLRKLEPILHAVLRVATGLPRWTPIPILRRESGSFSLALSFKYQRLCFVVRHLSLGRWSPISALMHPSGDSVVADQVDGLLQTFHISVSDILCWDLPRLPPPSTLLFLSDSLEFQDRSLSPTLISQLFGAYLSTRLDCHLIASDASKSPTRTCAAYWDIKRRVGRSYRVHDVNTVFTAEALGVLLALQAAPQCGRLLLFTDSRSVVSGLQALSFRSPRVLLHLYQHLVRSTLVFDEIHVIWVPGHCGIYGNEAADALARSHGCPGMPINWISPEDICLSLRGLLRQEESSDWLASKYATSFPHLTKRSWEHRKLRLPRRGEVLLSRLRTRTLPTRALLHRFHLTPSPLCLACRVPETSDHYLLECQRFRKERTRLFSASGNLPPSPTLADLCDLTVAGACQARSLVSYLLSTDRF